MDTGRGCRSETSSNLAVVAFAGREGGHYGQKESFISKCEEQKPPDFPKQLLW